MRVEELVEYDSPKPLTLTARQLQQVQAVAGKEVLITPNPGAAGLFDVTSQVVGGIVVDDLQIRIRPRFGIRSAMFLIAYALAETHWRELFPFATDGDLVDAI